MGDDMDILTEAMAKMGFDKDAVEQIMDNAIQNKLLPRLEIFAKDLMTDLKKAFKDEVVVVDPPSSSPLPSSFTPTSSPVNTPSEPKPRCTALTAKGSQCKHSALDALVPFCQRHNKNHPPADLPSDPIPDKKKKKSKKTSPPPPALSPGMMDVQQDLLGTSSSLQEEEEGAAASRPPTPTPKRKLRSRKEKSPLGIATLPGGTVRLYGSGRSDGVLAELHAESDEENHDPNGDDMHYLSRRHRHHDDTDDDFVLDGPY